MRSVIKGSKVKWIDIKNPTKKDIDYLKKEFNFHPLVLEELIIPSYRSKVESYPSYLFMIFYYPVYNKERRETRAKELDIIITKDAVITNHSYSILPLQKIFNRCKDYPRAKKRYMGQDSGHLLYHILNIIWKSCLTKLVRIDQRLDGIEKEMFAEKEKEMVLEISLVKTDIINFWRIIEPQKRILESLSEEGTRFFGETLFHYFSDISGTFEQILNALQTYKETVLALEDTNQSLLSTKINEIIKVLTVFSAIFLPLTLIASIWGMNIPMPLTKSVSGFWIISGVMIILVGFMIIFFHKKKWL